MNSAPDPVSLDAARWFARLRAPDCTAAERVEFAKWLASDPRHTAAFAAAERMTEALSKLAMIDPRLKAMVDQAAGAGATLPDDDEQAPPPHEPSSLTISAAPTRTRRRVARPFAWAASIGAALIAVLTLITLDDEARGAAEAGHQHAAGRPPLRYTSANARRAVTLDDGTRVYLDISTVIDVRFDNMQRTVTLTQGRALFDTAHDATRPFVVAVDARRVTALGTVFQVDREPAEVVVTLAQGAITVTSEAGDAAIPLAPGEQLRSSVGGTHWQKSTVDAESATSWSVGKHVFHDRPLADAIREINRYADKKVRIADSRLASLVVSGEFPTGNSESIVDAFAASLPLRVSATQGELVLSSAAADAGEQRAQF